MIIRKIKGILIVFSICGLFAALAFQSGHRLQTIETNAGDIRFILDAGHGNPDGGAVGIDKTTTEADLNLAITKKISAILMQKKINHILTRSDAESIYSTGDTIHEKKVSDVRNRIQIASQTPETPLISIHLNSYPDSSVHGIQVFYGNGQEAQTLALEMQKAINEEIQPNHTKVIKELSKNIYLFSHIDNPILLIECGFLSNSEELQKLKSEDYQTEIASVIAEVLSNQS